MIQVSTRLQPAACSSVAWAEKALSPSLNVASSPRKFTGMPAEPVRSPCAARMSFACDGPSALSVSTSTDRASKPCSCARRAASANGTCTPMGPVASSLYTILLLFS